MFAYVSMVSGTDLTAAGADVQTIAIWIVGILVSVACIGFLASLFK